MIMTINTIKDTLIQKLLGIFALFADVGPQGSFVVHEDEPEVAKPIMDIYQIAKTVHAGNNVLKKINKEKPEAWEDMSDDRKTRMYAAIDLVLTQDTTPKQMHDVWVKNMKELGYKYGVKLDHDKKTHPCLVAYTKLPAEQKIKDDMFRSIILSFK